MPRVWHVGEALAHGGVSADVVVLDQVLENVVRHMLDSGYLSMPKGRR